jgi:hypothetical protein
MTTGESEILRSRGWAFADLSASLDVLALGVGIGATFTRALTPLAVPLLVVGASVHGMLDKHRLER